MIRILTAWIVAVALFGCAADAASAADRAPNIILVMTDDQGYGDLACHGHPYLKTPNLDKLYAQSTRFTDFQVSPTCAPTRAALLSGRDAFRNGVTHTIIERERMSLDATTIAEVLKSAGYATAIFGKWHIGDEAPYQPDRRGFDEVFLHGGGGIGQAFPGSCADVPDNSYFDPIIRHNNRFVRTEGFCTDVFFDHALGWIKAHRDRPFFAYISTNAPHSPYHCPDEYYELYKGKSKDEKAARFYGMITNIDDNMGRLMSKLDAWGLADNTLLIFMSDNGTAEGDYNAGMKGKKGGVHEGGTRVPLFVRLPGRATPGADVDRLARHYDLFPTLVDVAGARTPDDLELDGRSLMPLIDDPDRSDWADRYTFFHRGRWATKKDMERRWGDGTGEPNDSKYRRFAVRSQRWRLVNRDELYDIRNDRGEQHNVIDEHPEVAAKMLEAFDAWWAEVRPHLVNEDVPLCEYKPYHVWYEDQKRTIGIPAWSPPQ